MSHDPLRAIADALLYEGYILWPYRRSALKNQRRFTFGGVYPPAHSAEHSDDPSSLHAEVLLVGEAASCVEISARFLQVVPRTVMGRCGEQLEEVDELVIDGERYVSWEEAVEREIDLGERSLTELRRGARHPIGIAPGRQEEAIGEAGDRLVRSWHGLEGELHAEAVSEAEDVWRVSATIANATPFLAGARQEALKRTFCSTHILLRVTGGEFVSLADPPSEFRDAAASCENAGLWPTLVGQPGDRSTVLASPIILDDYPRIAPESPGDLFDGGEIDQLLILNILALTDEEKAEMAASDPRAREILERTESLTSDQLMALHGTIREFGLAR